MYIRVPKGEQKQNKTKQNKTKQKTKQKMDAFVAQISKRSARAVMDASRWESDG